MHMHMRYTYMSINQIPAQFQCYHYHSWTRVLSMSVLCMPERLDLIGNWASGTGCMCIYAQCRWWYISACIPCDRKIIIIAHRWYMYVYMRHANLWCYMHVFLIYLIIDFACVFCSMWQMNIGWLGIKTMKFGCYCSAHGMIIMMIWRS